MSEWYVPGQQYQFRSLLSSDETQVVVISVVYDNNGVATASKSTEPANATDDYYISFFGPEGERQIQEVGNDINVILNPQDNIDYWYLPFENDNMQQINGGTITISCPCKVGTSACKVSYMLPTDTTVNVKCNMAAGCSKCDKPEIKQGIPNTTVNGICIKAENVVLS